MICNFTVLCSRCGQKVLGRCSPLKKAICYSCKKTWLKSYLKQYRINHRETPTQVDRTSTSVILNP